MITSRFAVLAIVAMTLAGSAVAGEHRKTQRVISEVAARMVSDLTYSEVLGQALRKGLAIHARTDRERVQAPL